MQYPGESVDLKYQWLQTTLQMYRHIPGIWRDRFGKHYDIAPGRRSGELKYEYQIRAIVLRSPIQFSSFSKLAQEIYPFEGLMYTLQGL
jgi:hypothetical protein